MSISDHENTGKELVQELDGLRRRLAQSNEALRNEIAERKRAEETRRRSEERFRRLFESDILAIAFWQADGRLTEANQFFCDLIGCAPEDVRTGRVRWNDVTPPALLARDRQGIDEINATGVCTPYEKQFIHRDGRRVPVLIGGAMLGGERDQGVAFAIDLTDRHRVEEALRQSERFQAAVLNSLAAHIAVLDKRGRISAINEPWARFARENGVSDMERIGVGVDYLEAGRAAAVADDPFAAAALDGIQAVLQGRQQQFEIEYPCHSPDQQRWFLMHVTPNVAAIGGAIVTHTDITERKRAEEAVRESEQRYRAIGESIDYGVWVCEPEGRNVYASESFLKLVGITQQQCSDFGWGDVLHPDDAERTIAAWKECVRTGGTWDIEHRFRGVDGQWHPILARGVPVRNELGQITCWAGINLDISRIKRAEEQLKSLNETLEQQVAERTAESHQRAVQLRAMVAEVSQAEQRERRRLSQVLHDHLQQLLVAARMKVQRLQRRAGQDEALAQLADEVDGLIDQCITESRSLTVELSPPVLYDGGLAAGLHWLARRVEEQNGLPVEVLAFGVADPADMDLRVFLFQAVRELLFNIVKHAHATRAHVSLAETEDGGLRIEVRDDGEGCDPERLTSRADSGGGFGLFNVRERLELLGGRLEIDTAPGEGTRVGIVIPPGQSVTAGEMALAQISPALPRHGPPTPGVVSESQGGLRVLLADDHPVVRKGLADLLREQAGIDVVIEARDGQEAVDLALEARPDVVMMDITMPRMDGIDATRQIKAQLPQVRVIGLSMHEDVDMAKAMCEAGASEYLRKDISSDALIAAIFCQPFP
jgi:PAS domain S-box-containing protein